MTNEPDITYGTLADIDAAAEEWMTTIKDAAASHIPKVGVILYGAAAYGFVCTLADIDAAADKCMTTIKDAASSHILKAKPYVAPPH
ncbi:hypothetical protein E2C01_049952 [Portunus trituberculatus]|uniref:Uncharacterized protein n=1 Tax=Portunus trituberculatus TaxID=210409 RepID=A0A5B7GF81_PORTR|nr:hypothetical protein [Portunus trituberculatus]